MCVFVSGLVLYLLLGLEDVTSEGIIGAVSCYVAEYLQILGVMGDVEDPAKYNHFKMFF